MSEDFKREEKVEKREEPGRVGTTLIILYFIANYKIGRKAHSFRRGMDS